MSRTTRVVLGLLLASIATTRAATIHVSPGPGTLQAAIDGASPGDRLELADGQYGAAVVHVPGLRIRGFHVKIGSVSDPVGLSITADGVRGRREGRGGRAHEGLLCGG